MAVENEALREKMELAEKQASEAQQKSQDLQKQVIEKDKELNSMKQ